MKHNETILIEEPSDPWHVDGTAQHVPQKMGRNRIDPCHQDSTTHQKLPQQQRLYQELSTTNSH